MSNETHLLEPQLLYPETLYDFRRTKFCFDGTALAVSTVVSEVLWLRWSYLRCCYLLVFYL